MEINHLFELLFKNQHDSFIRYYKKYETEINNNSLLPNPLKILMKELEDDFENLKPQKRTIEWTEALYGAHSGNILKLQDEHLERIIVCLIKLNRYSDLDLCKQYAKKFPNNLFCKEFLDGLFEEIPQTGRIVKLFHSQSSNEDLRKPNSKIGIKEKYKESIIQSLSSLRPSSFKPTSISQLYGCLDSLSHDFKDKQMYYDCLRELRDEGVINFKDTANGFPIYFVK